MNTTASNDDGLRRDLVDAERQGSWTEHVGYDYWVRRPKEVWGKVHSGANSPERDGGI
jgi:hypothetical protein